MQISDDQLIRDSIQFDRDLKNPNSGLSCFRNALFVLREQNIQKAKNAHSRRNEDRAAFFMGVVEGIDKCIAYPDAMLKKVEILLRDRELAPSVFEDGA